MEKAVWTVWTNCTSYIVPIINDMNKLCNL